MRLVHLAPASEERAISRAGLAGAKARILTGVDEWRPLRKAVFAMPVVRDFWTTYQWLRELRSSHDERMVAVYFRIPDAEPVLVGRYGQAHREQPASEAAAWVMAHPAGAEVVVPRAIGPKDVLRIRPISQLVGWKETPEPGARWSCLCQACVPRGSRDLMRRVRGAVAEALLAARKAGTPEDVLAALGRLETPLERARTRGLEPKGLLVHLRSRHPRVRQSAARLLGWFSRPQVEAPLRALLADEDQFVRCEAVDSLARAAGTRAAAAVLEGADEALVLHLLRTVEYEADDAAALAALERLAGHPSAAVRRQVSTIAAAFAAEGEAQDRVKLGLQALAEGRDARGGERGGARGGARGGERGGERGGVG